MSEYTTIETKQENRVLLISLNRPKALNALNTQIMTEVCHACAAADKNPDIAVIVITGNGKAFAAGADIKEMSEQTFASMYTHDFFGAWDDFARTRKPVIAAVNGFALGGGCELALMCDLVIASEKAKFGQPEIKLGVTPGMGGSQRLTKTVGKAVAMDLILTGRMIGAEEALRIGIASRVVPADEIVSTAMEVAAEIAAFSLPSLMAAKEMTLRALELSTTEGVKFERRLFHGLFGTEDQKEGMAAFVEKRPANFKDC